MNIYVEEGGGSLLGGKMEATIDPAQIRDLWHTFVTSTGFDKIPKDQIVKNIEDKKINKMSYYSKVQVGDRTIINYLGGETKTDNYNFEPVPNFVRAVILTKMRTN